MELGLTGKLAAVAGSTSGLGFAAARSLIDEGATVAICGVDEVRCKEAARRLGARAIPLVADLSVPEACSRFVVEASEALGGLDILVPNGPGPRPGTFAEVPAEAYQGALDLNLLSVVRMCLAGVPIMKGNGWGRIVAITSVAVRQPIANLILSNTARSGATGFLKTLAREVAADGITVNSVQPGLHATERVNHVYQDGVEAEIAQIPARRLGQADDFGAVIAFLCSEQAKYLTGAALPVDGGLYQGLL